MPFNHPEDHHEDPFMGDITQPGIGFTDPLLVLLVLREPHRKIMLIHKKHVCSDIHCITPYKSRHKYPRLNERIFYHWFYTGVQKPGTLDLKTLMQYVVA